MELYDYLVDLKDKLEVRDLLHFWVMAERQDFKPMKGYDKKQIKKYLKSKAEYYEGKKIAEVFVYIDPKALTKNKIAMSIKVVIYLIEEGGAIDKNSNSIWVSAINFKEEDLEIQKFKLKLVEQIMKVTTDEIIETDALNGMGYLRFVKKLKKKGIKLMDY